MAELTEEQFAAMPPEERASVLKEMSVEQKFRNMSPKGREEVLRLLEARQERPDISRLEAGVRGAAQGLTFGFSDEIVAGLTAGAKSLMQDKDFQEIYGVEIEKARRADIAAESEFPGTFLGAEAAGALATTAIPGGIFARGAQAGRGLGAGLAGIARGTAGAAATAAGKTEAELGSEQFQKEMAGAAGVGAGVQTAANVLGPFARIIAKHSGKFAKGAAVSQLGFAKTAVAQSSLKEMSKAVGNKYPELTSALNKAAKSTAAGADKFTRMLAESFEKRGGAGLVTMHTLLLQDPGYQQFIKRDE
jgi:hypothetical protein